MKNKILTVIVTMLACVSAFGQNLVGNASSGGLNYGAGTTNYAIIPQAPKGMTTAQDANGALKPVIKFLSATSDALASATTGAGNVQFYKATNYVFFTATSTATTNTISYNATPGIGSSNGLGQNSEIVIQHTTPSPDTYELAYVSAVSAPVTTNISTNGAGVILTNFTSTLTLAVVPTNTTVPGDIVWMMSTNGVGKIPVGVATLNLGPGDGIFTGNPNQPLLMIIRGGTNASINAVSAGYGL